MSFCVVKHADSSLQMSKPVFFEQFPSPNYLPKSDMDHAILKQVYIQISKHLEESCQLCVPMV